MQQFLTFDAQNYDKIQFYPSPLDVGTSFKRLLHTTNSTGHSGPDKGLKDKVMTCMHVSMSSGCGAKTRQWAEGCIGIDLVRCPSTSYAHVIRHPSKHASAV